MLEILLYSEKLNNDIEYCISQNILNKHVSKVHLFSKDKYIDDKVVNINSCEVVKFSEFFKYANSLGDKKNVIIINNNIILDDSISHVLNNLDNKLVTLNSYNRNKLIDNITIQNSWCFSTPFNIKMAEFIPGSLNSSGMINYLASVAGYVITNPCGQIKTHSIELTNKTEVVKNIINIGRHIYPEYTNDINDISKLVVKTI